MAGLPLSEVPPYGEYEFHIQGRGADDSVGPRLAIAGFTAVNSLYPRTSIPFLDGRRHLKENLIFQFRVARGIEPFKFTVYPGYPVNEHAVSPSSVSSGFHVFNPASNVDWLNEFA